MEALGKIFGSNTRVKIMRLFLFNETQTFDLEELSKRTRVKKPDTRKEINLLLKIGFLKKKTFTKKVLKKSRKKNAEPEYKQERKNGFVLNKKFELIRALQILLIETELIKGKDLAKRIRKAGKIKLLLLSGLFVQDTNRSLDILIVGEKIKKEILEREINIIESEIGRELHYAFFDEEEFRYRQSMYDKLIRDVIENAHKRLVDSLSEPY